MINTHRTELSAGTAFRSFPTPAVLPGTSPTLFSRVTAAPAKCFSIDVSSRFGLKLRQLRRDRNLTQTRMATVFGIDRSFISDVERGRKSISLPTLEVIALGLNMSLSDLLKDV